MYQFVCAHGAEAAVTDGIVWFFTPCIPCERDPLTMAQFVLDAQRIERRLAHAS